MEVVDSFEDKSGRNVRVEDNIIYGHNIGRSAGLRFGRVKQIRCDRKMRNLGGETREFVKWSITIQGLNDDSSWRGERIPCLLDRKSTLYYPSRILLVNEIMPEQYAAMLDDAEVQ